MRIDNGRVPGYSVIRFDDREQCSLGAPLSREWEMSLNYFMKLEFPRTSNLRMESWE